MLLNVNANNINQKIAKLDSATAIGTDFVKALATCTAPDQPARSLAGCLVLAAQIKVFIAILAKVFSKYKCIFSLPEHVVLNVSFFVSPFFRRPSSVVLPSSTFAFLTLYRLNFASDLQVRNWVI